MADNTRQVITHADDFGLHLDNTWNYIYVHPYGVVSSTPAMVNLRNNLEEVKIP
ncbi:MULTISPECIES: hypothetical protein [Clostridia]|uniref:hypothetical protein n=1 Tax=Clostridia TaxID=186801 RepID=UPI0013144C26|nr:MULTISPECIES: hypothetical protein [Clostridia]